MLEIKLGSTSYQIISLWKYFDILFVSFEIIFGVILIFSCQLMQSLKPQGSVIHEAIYWLPSMKDSAVNFIVIASPLATLKMKPNVNPAKVIIQKDRIRIMNTLFNLKLQAPDKEVAALLKRKPPYAIFFSTFPEKLFLWIADFERLRCKISISKTRKVTKDQEKNFQYALKMCS